MDAQEVCHGLSALMALEISPSQVIGSLKLCNIQANDSRKLFSPLTSGCFAGNPYQEHLAPKITLMWVFLSFQHMALERPLFSLLKEPA